MSEEVLAIARQFASALDAEDYLAARKLLAHKCVYHINGATIVGTDAIIESYRRNGDSAKERFDSVEYLSDIESSGPSAATIVFKDLLRVGNTSHEFSCRQHLRIGLAGQIEEIRHDESPDERERLRDFEERF